MLKLSWVQAQIQEAINGQNEPQNVRDFALLCIARDNLIALAEKDLSQNYSQDDGKNQAVVLTNYSADLDTVPTLQQIGDALQSVACHSVEDKQKIRDMRTWADIISNKG